MSWRSYPLLLAFLFCFASAQEIYRFSEDGEQTFCPVVESESVFVDFILQPNITISGFPNGTYEVQADGFDFDRQTVDCENGVMCSQLAARFTMSSTPEPGSFEVVYTPYDGTRRTTRIRINYATTGIYIVPSGTILRPLPDRSALDGYAIVYGTQSSGKFLFCDANGNETKVFGVQIDGNTNECSRSTNGVRPSRVDIRISEQDDMGDHSIYIGRGTCSSDSRSVSFDVSLSAVPTTTETTSSPDDVTTPPVTTDDVGGTGSPSNGYVTVIVAVMGSVLGVVLIAIIVVVAIVVVVKRGVCFANRGKGQEHVENGPSSPHLSPNTRLLLEGSNEPGGDTNIAESNGHPKVPKKQIKYIAFSGSDQDNWFQSMKRELLQRHDTENHTIVDRLDLVRDDLIKRDCLLYILQYGSQEITSPVDKAPRPPSSEIMSELESLGFTEESKNNIFVVRFGADGNDHISTQSRYHILTRKEDPSKPGFSSYNCAELIHSKVREIRGEGSLDEADGQNERVGKSNGWSSDDLKVIVKTLEIEGQKTRDKIEKQRELTDKTIESEHQKTREAATNQTAEIIMTVERGKEETLEDIEELGKSVDKALADKDQADVEPAPQDP